MSFSLLWFAPAWSTIELCYWLPWAFPRLIRGEEQDPADAGPVFLACRQENIFSADYDQQYLERKKKKRRKIEDALFYKVSIRASAVTNHWTFPCALWFLWFLCVCEEEKLSHLQTDKQRGPSVTADALISQVRLAIGGQLTLSSLWQKRWCQCLHPKVTRAAGPGWVWDFKTCKYMFSLKET